MPRFFLLISVLTMLASSAFSANCSISTSDEKNLLSLTYEHFDQEKLGWRQYGILGCYHEAGILIDKYLKQNQAALKDWQIIGIVWHAGQMYAFNNEYKIAKMRFVQSINPNELKTAPILWNDYVFATIAFLDNDMPTLKIHRDKIANGPTVNGIKLNLNVVENLIYHFGQPYAIAYRASQL